MREQVLDILAAAARKLRFARAVEAAALGATIAALCAAAWQLAWTLAWLHPLAAAACCAAPVPLALVPAMSHRVRRWFVLSRGQARAMGAFCVAASGAGVACVLTGATPHLPKLVLGLLLVPAGALAGAALAGARRVSLVQAGLFHDVRLGLAERLSTAAELAGSAGRDKPLAQCVYAQALATASDRQVARRSVWRRSRSTVAALGLSLALCAAMALLPTAGRVDVEKSFEQIRARAGDLSPATRKGLVETLRRLAALAEKDPALRDRLREAADAAAKNEKLQERLIELEQSLATADDAEAARIARELLGATGSEGGDVTARPVGPGDANAPEPLDANALAGAGGVKPLPARVLVYDRTYRNLIDANASPGPEHVRVGPHAFLRLDDAWADARARAAAALADGRVPAEYRTLLRRFFEID